MTDIRKVAICGAGGTMGAGIAIVAARGGFETVCFDMSAEALARQRRAAGTFFGTSVEKGRMSAGDREATLARMSDTTDLADLAECDLVIEAIFEDLDIKKDLFGKLDRICKEGTIFASNTSTLSITEIAAGSGRADRVVGMHFCLPAQVMKLIEMSRGLNTSDETFRAAWAWTEACGQSPVETQDKPGFILNALLVPFNNDVIRAIEAGLASAEEIDLAIRSALGYRMGPCTLLDLIGLDTQLRLGEAFYPITLDPRAAVPPLCRRMVAAGRLGTKSGGGLLTGRLPEKAVEAPAYSLRSAGESRSFPAGDPFLAGARDGDAAEVTIHLGSGFAPDPAKTAVLVELDTECLGLHTGEDMGREGSNAVGFARYRNGDDPPSNLIELVRQPATDPAALAAARAVFDCAGFDVVTCADRPGRIVDRLVRPKYNDALRFLDDGLAAAEEIDRTCRMGLGYPDGPIERVTRGGLARHCEISNNIFKITGQTAFAPQRAPTIQKIRAKSE
ncbi:3-hydroxyacyl-CoA dehydrogenase NAD-binding domain-containing protein [Celeribacter indicus]|uniref:3-hydroxyacyl-CoA dehydrogenase n=1 Tax=Celeribacter indicus TaxID=1208324 RepID=A0A0B5EA84_9RHOB|nr:3-hydroxyacyl-CoA dehydrogenase NAD-binding domain-containing protein [Celeribacter indicus]AJE49164.1 3-hydroxyacyl-CoA dehydrogenase [Celeribacter indicus]AJE49192.1 3-hydroxyacyl-CoA dehydrogenase [Celeribacter indicus]SDX17918.1 3-hydroxybutyryl-CoA dehydrogenase [Celeribacter indicus]SDX18499.1 3-hydroxybutyryl-CoA dehydrogenase [Celeribacter indicus]